MLFRSYQRIIPLMIVLLLFSRCDKPIFNSGIKQGVIQYKISYPELSDDNYMLDLMPKEMETIFSDNEFRSDIIAGMGLFKTSIICNKDQEKLIHTVKLLNKKYASNLGYEDIKKINPYLNNVEIEYTDNTKKIAGYTCKEAVVTVHGDSSWQFNLYYTNDIRLEMPNRQTPFEEINGVLMEYEMINYNTHMHFVADKVIEKEIQRDHILLESDYEMVSPDKLNDEIKAIFDKVK